MTEFTDARWMTARQKRNVLAQWRRMLAADLADREKWMRCKALYTHLTLHCGHIAHFDQAGFFAAQMANPTDRRRFLDETVEYMRNAHYPAAADMRDIHDAMTAEAERHEARIVERCKRDRIDQLKRYQAAITAELEAVDT